MSDPSYLSFGCSSLTHITSISFVITTYLHVILFACLPSCFVGGVLVGGLLSRLSLFFFNDFKRLGSNNHSRPKHLESSNHVRPKRLMCDNHARPKLLRFDMVVRLMRLGQAWFPEPNAGLTHLRYDMVC